MTAGAEPVIVGHRGASKDAPENTLPAFALAWERGADAIEGDFHVTKDGVIVCIHDGDTKRVAGVNLKVKEATFAELRGLDVGLWRGERWRGTRIPTLGEVLATVSPGKKIYIEVKCGREIVGALFEVVAKSGLEKSQVVVISFHEDVIRAVEDKDPEVVTYWLSGFKKAKSGEVTPSAEVVLETLKRSGADGIGSGKDHVGEGFVRKVLGEGFEYHVWTVDDLAEATKFGAWGALSITTNVPGAIRAGLAGAESE